MGINRLLLQYAAPCARIFKRTGLMSGEDYKTYHNAVRGDGEFSVDKFREIFWKPCKKMDPEKVSDERVRKYFLEEHNMEVNKWCHAVDSIVKKKLPGEKVIVERLDMGREIEAYVDMPYVPEVDEKVILHIDGVVDKI